MKEVTMVDPPGGWMYGFPKPLPDNAQDQGVSFDFGKFLELNGYPKKDISLALEHSRFWKEFI